MFNPISFIRNFFNKPLQPHVIKVSYAYQGGVFLPNSAWKLLILSTRGTEILENRLFGFASATAAEEFARQEIMKLRMYAVIQGCEEPSFVRFNQDETQVKITTR